MTSDRIIRSLPVPSPDAPQEEWEALFEAMGLTPEKRAQFVRTLIEAAQRAQAQEADGAA